MGIPMGIHAYTVLKLWMRDLQRQCVSCRLLPYFDGTRHIEDIMYYENMSRTDVFTRIDKFLSMLYMMQAADPATSYYAKVSWYAPVSSHYSTYMLGVNLVVWYYLLCHISHLTASWMLLQIFVTCCQMYFVWQFFNTLCTQKFDFWLYIVDNVNSQQRTGNCAIGAHFFRLFWFCHNFYCHNCHNILR